MENKQLIRKEEEYVIKYIQKSKYTLEECVEILSQTLKLTSREIWSIISISAQKKIYEITNSSNSNRR